MTRQPFKLHQFQFFVHDLETLPGVFAELDKLNLAHAAELPALVSKPSSLMPITENLR